MLFQRLPRKTGFPVTCHRLDDHHGAVQVACIEDGLIFRCVTHSGTVWGSGITEKVVWWVVRRCARKVAIEKVAPHDLRRTCARLCHAAGGELEQIQFLLGHRSVETTERYLGSRQRIVHAVNDKLGIEPDAGPGGGTYRKTFAGTSIQSGRFITGRCYILLLFIGRRTMGTKRTINKQGTRAVRCGAKAAVIRQAASIRSTQTAKRTKRAIEWVALCIHSPFGFSRANQFQTVYAPSCAG
jgi:hypothetical protein